MTLKQIGEKDHYHIFQITDEKENRLIISNSDNEKFLFDVVYEDVFFYRTNEITEDKRYTEYNVIAGTSDDINFYNHILELFKQN